MGAALKFKQANIPRQQGEQARLKVVLGPDYGSIYVVRGGRALIGRGEECDIVLSDLKASRKHAELSVAQQAPGAPLQWSVRDAGSANGIAHNGKPSRQAALRTGDTISLGETMLEFLSAPEAGTQMLVAPPRSAGEIQSEQAALEQRRKSVREVAAFGQIASKGPAPVAAAADPGKKRQLLLIVGALGAAFMLFGTEDKKPAPSGKPAAASAAKAAKPDEPNISSYISGLGSESSEATKVADNFFKSGFREYREGNYLRAKQQFDTALQIVPSHPMARLYRTNSDLAIQETVKNLLTLGKKASSSGKLREAKGHYEAVQRLLFSDQTAPAYIEAGEQLEKVKREMKGEALKE